MKELLKVIVGLLIIISCSNKNGQNNQRELIPNPEKYVHDNVLQNDSITTPFKPDISIGKISLLSTKNIDTYLGKDLMARVVKNDFLASSITSKDGKQRLTFYFHPGSANNKFSEFQVNYTNQKTVNNFSTNDNEFVTESGIKLGMTMGNIMSIKGKPYSISNNELTVFHYKIDNYNDSEFLIKYNTPIYYADYEFKNGYLIKFRFGFEYP